jgi:HlyD family secretion protein
MSDDKITGAPPTEPVEPSGGALVPKQLPATIPPSLQPPRRGRWLRRALLLLILIAAGLGGGYLWQQSQYHLPPGIFSGNGRAEADEIDIDTKYAGRIAQLMADEGDMVKAGEVVAVMDTRDLEATLKRDEALAAQAQRALDEAKANLAQQQPAAVRAARA